MAGAAWADRAPQKFTGPVDIYDLMDGDTLASGFSLTYGHGQQEIIRFVAGRYSIDGTPQAYPGGADLTGDHELQSLIFTASNILMYFGEERTDTIAPMVDMSTPGNAWVVSDFNKGTEGVTMKISGIYIAPDPYVPALDETTGNWNFLMPGANKVVKAVLYDSIVVGPHVELYDAQPAFAAGDIYTRGDSTIYYYDTNNHHSFHLRADEQAGGKFFGFWSDLDPTDDQYTDRTYRYVGPGNLTCGHRFTAAYPENHTLTLVTPQGGGTLEIAGVTYDTVYNINFYHIGSLEGTRSFTIPASRLPYDTTFNYNANVSMVQLDEQPGKLRKIQVEQSVTIRIEGAFEGTAHYTCMLDGDGDPDEWVITCTAGTQPIMPYGISKTGDNTYSVMEGLTVNVTATPEAGFRLTQWSDQTEPVEGDARLGGSHPYPYTMPATDATLTATFVQNPMLTLASNGQGTVTLDGITPGATTYDITISENPYPDVTYTNVSFPFHTTVFLHEGLSSVDVVDQTPLIAVKNGDNADITINGPYGGTIMYGYGAGEGGVKAIFCDAIEGLPIMPEGVTYAGYDTYLVLPGTTVNVTATPDSAHYFKNWTGEADAISNEAVVKTLTMGTDDTELTANFQAKPTLTLTQTDGGTLEAIVPEPAATAIVPPTDQISGWENDYGASLTEDNMPAEFGFVAVDQAAAEAWAGVPASGDAMLIYGIEGDTLYCLSFHDGSLTGNSTVYFSFGTFYQMASAGILYITTGTHSNMTASTEPNTYYIDYGTPVPRALQRRRQRHQQQHRRREDLRQRRQPHQPHRQLPGQAHAHLHGQQHHLGQGDARRRRQQQRNHRAVPRLGGQQRGVARNHRHRLQYHQHNLRQFRPDG